MKLHAFPKPEHLCLKRDIERLFSAGSHALTAYPLRVVYRRTEHTVGAPIQVLVSVAKRRLHHAVDRNRAKRQLREAYRLRKSILNDTIETGEGLHIALIWLSEAPADSDTVHAKMEVLLRRMAEKLKPTTPDMPAEKP